MKTIFENSGGYYTQQCDCLLPNPTLPDENKRQIDVLGTRLKGYLKSNHRILYYKLLTSCKLDD